MSPAAGGKNIAPAVPANSASSFAGDSMKKYPVILFSLWLLASLVLPAQLYAHHTREHVTLHCDSEQVLNEFNKKLELGPRLCTLVEQKNYVTVEDELTAKFNAIIEQAKVVLNMYPKNLHVKVVILPTARDCSAVFAKKYGLREKKIAYYSLSENTIYISATDTKAGVVAHELAHAIVDFYFSERPPYHIHEMLAQSVEQHLESNEELIKAYRRLDENGAMLKNVCAMYPRRDE
ncbi:hypothetical protein JT06_10440 [Desulfobulbus sp. Tol-SR]|nr:hypothetical protein JT06_10440 [Desulfobulbus sp. Tol-SR]